MAEMKKYGADLVVDSLNNHGVDLVFGIPGAKIDRLKRWNTQQKVLCHLSWLLRVTNKTLPLWHKDLLALQERREL